MPIFRYKGYKTGGGETAGAVEAENAKDALHKIKELGLYPRSIEESIHKRSGGKSGGLPSVTRQLSVLVKSGVPLMEALRAIAEENKGFRDVIVGIKERVQGGATLARAMEGYPEIFPEFYRSMVASGEASGSLDEVLERLSGFLESQSALRDKVRTAMIYPSFMASVGFIVLAFLFSFVIPKIVKIFEDVKSALPLMTVILIKISNLFINYWWLLAGSMLAFLYAARNMRVKHRVLIDRTAFGLPLQSLYLSRFSRTLGFLLSGGLPMLRALELAGKSSGNAHLEGKIREAAMRVSDGASLSTSLAGLPPVLIELISTGEKSGKLAEVLERAADSYEGEFDRIVKRALALIEPVMILGMGLVVGFVVLAVLLPMFQLNQLIR